MLVIIMCAGQGSRWKVSRGYKVWGNYLGVRKQLIVVGGETLLDRTIRLLRERGVKDVVVTIPRKRQRFPIKDKDVEQVVNKTKFETERFMTVDSEEVVLYLYGDVFYTEKAMDNILGVSDYQFFGRRGPSSIGGKTHGELFAVKAKGSDVLRWKNKVIGALKEGVCRRGIGWDLYKAAHNQAWLPERGGDLSFVFDIDDETDDFDNPDNYDSWIKSVYKEGC